MSYQVRNRFSEAKLQELVRECADRLPAHLGFMVLVFDYTDQRTGDNGNLFYAARAERSEMIETLKELIIKLEKDA